MLQLGLIPGWQFGSDPATNPALTPSLNGLGGAGLGDTVSDCLAQAQAQTAPFDNAVSNLGATWKPTGTYTAQDVDSLVSAINGVNQKAIEIINQQQAAIENSLGLASGALQQRGLSQDQISAGCANIDASEPSGVVSYTQCLSLANYISGSGVADHLNQGLDDIAKNALQGSLYAVAVTTAIAQTQGTLQTLISAPLLKDWVIKSLNDASSAINAASDSACLIQNIPSAWGLISDVFNAVISAAKTVIGVAADVVQKTIQAGGQVLKAAEQIIAGSVGIIGFLSKYGLWIGLGVAAIGGGIYLWPKIKAIKAEGIGPYFRRLRHKPAPAAP